MPRSAALFDAPDTLALDWKGLYQEHAPRLRRIAERRVGSEQAEDVVQDTFMRAFRNRESLDPSRPIGAWLSAITLCSSTDALRRRSTRPEVPVSVENEPVSSGESLEDQFDNAVRRMGIEAAFDSLNLRQRRVLQRLEVDGWSHEQVAAVEHMSTDAVKSLAARARRSFRRTYSAFAEHMGVFGGAAVGPAVWRIRARFQRWQGTAGEHVGAFGMAVATVTVVAIAAVPTAREVPAIADDSVSAPAAADESTQDGTSSRAASVDAPVSPAAPASAQSTVSSDTPTTSSTPESSNLRAGTTAAAGRNGTGGGVGITAETDGPQDDSTTGAGLFVKDCSEGIVGPAFCVVVDTADDHSPSTE